MMERFMYGILFMILMLLGEWFVLFDYKLMYDTELSRLTTLALAFVGFMIGVTKPKGIMKYE